VSYPLCDATTLDIMRSDLTEIAFILDRSGSMEPLTNEAVGGFNAFLETQQREPGAAALISLVLFDNEYLLVYRSQDIHQVPKLTDQVYQARGTTALRDAIGITIDGLGEKLDKTPEPLRPGKVIVAILTDGLENASQRYNHPMIAKRIKHQREKYGWEFVFLAANQDAVLTGTGLGVHREDCTTFAPTAAGVRHAYTVASDRTLKARRRNQSN
jgi:uncharacterized protein YegL